MELWVRSQDKEQLLKVIGLYYDYQQQKHHITCITENDYYWVGIYATKERALEVLNEIQNILKPKIIVKSGKPVAETLDGVVYKTPDEVEIKELSVVVYEMPKE